MSSSAIHTTLQQLTGRELDLYFHTNRVTYLAVYERPRLTVRLHQQFLSAPEPVLFSLAHFIQGRRGDETIPLKKFVYESILSATTCIAPAPQQATLHAGVKYNLHDLYSKLNQKYFGNQLAIQVTWFGNKKRKLPTRSMQIGLFDDFSQTAKVHSLLDSSLVPKYVVEYVLFHEMIHAVCPTEVDSKGHVRVHTAAFKKKEKEYPHHLKAENWLKENLHRLFSP